MPLTNSERQARWRKSLKLKVVILESQVAELKARNLELEIALGRKIKKSPTPKILQPRKTPLPKNWRKDGIPVMWALQQPAFQEFRRVYAARLEGQSDADAVLAWVRTHPSELS